MVVKAKPIGASAWLQEGRKLAIDAPFEDAIIWLIRKKDIAAGIAGRTFGEREISGKLSQRLAFGDDVGIRTEGADAGICHDESHGQQARRQPEQRPGQMKCGCHLPDFSARPTPSIAKVSLWTNAGF